MLVRIRDWDPSPLLPALLPVLKKANGAIICSAYVKWSGVGRIWPELTALDGRASKLVRFFIGVGNGSTSVEAIEALHSLRNAEVICVPPTHGPFHSKLYFFTFPGDKWHLTIGSPNLTGGGTSANWETLVEIEGAGDPPSLVQQLTGPIESLKVPFPFTLVNTIQDVANQLVPEHAQHPRGWRPRPGVPARPPGPSPQPTRVSLHPTRGLIVPASSDDPNVSGMRDLLLFELTRWDAERSFGNQVTIPQESAGFFAQSDRPPSDGQPSRRNLNWFWVDSGKFEAGYLMWAPAAHSFRLSSKRLRSRASTGDILVVGRPRVKGAYQLTLVSKRSPDYPAYLGMCQFRAPAHGKRWGLIHSQ